jgi:hypothetical protein
MLFVDIEDTVENADGTVTVVLSCDDTRVRAEALAWFDADEDDLLVLFEEWHGLALEGEEGYTVL